MKRSLYGSPKFCLWYYTLQTLPTLISLDSALCLLLGESFQLCLGSSSLSSHLEFHLWQQMDKCSLTSFVSYVSRITDLHRLMLTVIKTLFNLFISSDFLLVSGRRLDTILVASSWPELKVYMILFSSNLWMTKLVNLIYIRTGLLMNEDGLKGNRQLFYSDVNVLYLRWVVAKTHGY